jgi:HEAT repeat protein
MEQGDWDKMIVLLEPFRTRLQQDLLPEERARCTAIIDRVGESSALRDLINRIYEQPEEMDRAVRVVQLLGEHAVRPLINTLKNSPVMQERSKLMHILREYGEAQQALLVEELRAQNPWYVYRNLLQILAEVGTDESLRACGEKVTHPDPRVRVEALSAAARIGKDRAASYLVQGLEDTDVNVRARAASLVSLCPQPRVLEMLLRILQSREPDNVQLPACLGLGYFDQDDARQTLLQILNPGIFSPYRKKGPEIRSAAVTALGQHLLHPAVQTAVKQATSDKHPLVRQTAQKVWQQHQLQESSGPTA